MTVRASRAVSAIIVALLWGTGMLLWQSTEIDTFSIVTVIVIAAITGLLWYYLFDKFTGFFQKRG
jgi:hypothetical protein